MPRTPLPTACRRAQIKAGIMGLDDEAGEDAGDVGDGQKKASHWFTDLRQTRPFVGFGLRREQSVNKTSSSTRLAEDLIAHE